MRRLPFILPMLAMGLAGCRSLDTARLDEAIASDRVAAMWRTARGPRSDAHRLLLESTVRIQHEYEQGGRTIVGHGTAFAVDLTQYGFPGRRFLLTAAHNTIDEKGRPYETLRIEIVDRAAAAWSRCRAVAWDTDLDLAIVESETDLPALLELADGDVPVGSALVMAGSPRGIPVELFNATLEKKFERGMLNYSIRVPFDHGNSGGPIVDDASNRVVGVMVAGVPKGRDLDPNIGLCVPPVGIATFLEAHRRGAAASLRIEAPAVAKAAHAPRPEGSPAGAAPLEPAIGTARTPVAAVPAGIGKKKATGPSGPPARESPPVASHGPAARREVARTAAEKILDEFE